MLEYYIGYNCSIRELQQKLGIRNGHDELDGGGRAAMEEVLKALNQYFGYTEFRSGQAELIQAQLAGRDVFGIMPTGGGKSVCYQIPALLMEGITLVVSPLISLMKDQVMALKDAGIAAAYINSSLTKKQIQLVYRRILEDKYKIIYIAPERLLAEGFLRTIRQIRIAMVAVDEAHCISQWGKDFRPSYLRIVDFLKLQKKRPVVSAFTATATLRVREDVKRILELREPLCITTGFDRPNLHFEVLRPKNKMAALQKLIAARRDRCGIIYCATRKDVERVCETLRGDGVATTRYHAGLAEEERQANQEDFIHDRCSVIVATNAFGMGIDKSNVGYVIHYTIPQSVEAYYQEAGRAGRDGEKAECILLYSASDIMTAKFLIQSSGENGALPAEEQKRVIAQKMTYLNEMIRYCKTKGCLRSYILEYFGQEHKEKCGNCGNCEVKFEEKDITVQAKMILSCVRRIQSLLRYSMGATAVAQVLRGSSNKNILTRKLDTLSVYGLMREVSEREIKEMIEELEEQGYLRTRPQHGVLELTRRADAVLFQGKPIKVYVRKSSQTAKTEPEGRQVAEDLLERLREVRMRIASEKKMPAYIIFSNVTLRDMAVKAPTTMDAFLQVSGVGKYKAEQYGEAFLTEIKRYRDGM